MSGGSRSARSPVSARRAATAASGPLPSRVRRPLGPCVSIPPVRDRRAMLGGMILMYPGALEGQPLASRLARFLGRLFGYAQHQNGDVVLWIAVLGEDRRLLDPRGDRVGPLAGAGG